MRSDAIGQREPKAKGSWILEGGNPMNLTEIKDAVLRGKKVHWKSGLYEVICDSVGQWLIVCRSTGGCWGLTWADKTTVNGEPKDFFVG